MRTAPALALAVAVAASATALATEPDPWARVPALPTGCYQNDGFAERLQTADEAVTRDIDRQKEINKQLEDQVKNADPMTLASRQQQWMMDHPQEAMALMQRNAAQGTQEASDGRLQDFANRDQLFKDLEAVDARYKAALDAEFAPIDVKFKDLDARAAKDPVRTEAGDFYKPWAVKEWNALNAQRNAAYEKVCATWWAPSGAYRGWLTRYREYAAGLIPKMEEADNLGAGFMVIMVGTPQASFKSPAALTEVNDYMDQVAKVFAKRWDKPFPNQEGIEGGRPLAH